MPHMRIAPAHRRLTITLVVVAALIICAFGLSMGETSSDHGTPVHTTEMFALGNGERAMNLLSLLAALLITMALAAFSNPGRIAFCAGSVLATDPPQRPSSRLAAIMPLRI